MDHLTIDNDDADLPDEMPLPDSYLIKKRLSVHLERRRGSLTDAAKEHASHAFSYLMRTFASSNSDISNSTSEGTANDVYGFHVRDLNGNDVSLEQYRGLVLLIVNVASECGLTSVNYDHLNYLHQKFYDKGLRILAFPCNQFGGQEPGSSPQIAAFLEKKSVEFNVFFKIDVNGKDAHPLFLFLQTRLPGSITNDIKWNFTKFLINRQGIPVDRFAPTTAPKEMEDKIISLLHE
jgi:glutathione peroxidase-family protein